MADEYQTEEHHLDEGSKLRESEAEVSRLREAQADRITPQTRRAATMRYNLRRLCEVHETTPELVIADIMGSYYHPNRPAIRRWLKRAFRKGLNTPRNSEDRLQWLVKKFKLHSVDDLWADLDLTPVSVKRINLTARMSSYWRVAEKLMDLLADGKHDYLGHLILDLHEQKNPQRHLAAQLAGEKFCVSCKRSFPADDIEKYKGRCRFCSEGKGQREHCAKCGYEVSVSELVQGRCSKCRQEAERLKAEYTPSPLIRDAKGNWINNPHR